MAAFSRPKSSVDIVKSLPIFIGLFAILLSLPTILIHLDQQQNLEKFAQARSFVIPTKAKYVPGRIIIKYRPDIELQTSSSVNQHAQSFSVNNITSGLSSTSLSGLQAVDATQMSRIFKSARLPQEKNFIQNFLSLFGAGPKPDPLANYVEVSVPNDSNLQNAINLLLKDPNVVSVQPDYVAHNFLTPNDPKYSEQWAPVKVNAPAAWDTTTGSSSVTVAVVDSGIDLTHPDLQANIISGSNFVNPGTPPQDDQGHGTMVSGIIGAIGNNGIGVAGMNWKVKLMPLEAANSQGESAGSADAAAIRYAADNGAKIINMSWGENVSDPTVADAISYAASKGLILIAAAGNGSAEDSPTITPANLPQVIAVSATDQNDQLASFSSYGSNISVAAPGVFIGSTGWSGASPSGELPECAGVQYCAADGTSFSSPMVAGIAALMLSVNPNLSAAQVRTILQNTADHLGTPGQNVQFGYGRVNAANAVAAAQAAVGSSTPSPTATATPAGSATPTPTPAGSASPTPSGQTAVPTATPVASVGNLPTSAIQIISTDLASVCGGQAIISEKDSSSANGGTHWISYAANYGGISFTPSGNVFVYVPKACSVSLTLNGTATGSATVCSGATCARQSNAATTCRFGFLCNIFSRNAAPQAATPAPTPTCKIGFLCPLFSGGAKILGTVNSQAGKKVEISTFQVTPAPVTPTPAQKLLLPNPTAIPAHQGVPTPPTPPPYNKSLNLLASQTLQFTAGWNQVTANGTCQNVQVSASGLTAATVSVNTPCTESITVGTAAAQVFNFLGGSNQVSASGSLSSGGGSKTLSNPATEQKSSKNILQLILGK